MAVRVEYVIMAHPTRQTFVQDLRAQLPQSGRTNIVWDRINSRIETGYRCLTFKTLSPTTHLAVIQDDAILSADFDAGLNHYLATVSQRGAYPLSPHMLYVGNVRPYREAVIDAINQSSRHDNALLVWPEVIWGVGVVYPVGCLPALAAWYRRQPDRDPFRNYDRRVGFWFRDAHIPVLSPIPSLLDHRDSPSLVPGRGGHRHAHRFIGTDISATSIAWDGPAIEVGKRAKPRSISRVSRTRSRA